jgi:hypothetical protein
LNPKVRAVTNYCNYFDIAKEGSIVVAHACFLYIAKDGSIVIVPWMLSGKKKMALLEE